jgi:hypothetical protein
LVVIDEEEETAGVAVEVVFGDVWDEQLDELDELLDELDELLEDMAMTAGVAIRLNKRNKFKFLIVFMINSIKYKFVYECVTCGDW